MTDAAIGASSLPVLLALILLRVPIGLAMFGVGLVGLVLVTGDWAVPLGRLKSETYTTFSSYTLSIVPMFLLMGQFATLGGLSGALFQATRGFLGHRRGGVAMASIAACAGFGAICGSSLATAATMGRVALPELRASGYDGGLATATLAAGGTLGILIPPSIVLVIYAILTDQNIANLFVAAIVPGILAALGYMAAVALYVRRHPDRAGRSDRTPWPHRLHLVAAVWPVLLVFGLVVGGIYGGLFTPTEGAAVGAAGTALVAWRRGGLTPSTMATAFTETATTTAMIFLIVLGAAFYNGFLALTGVPQSIAAWVGSVDLPPVAVICVILLFYLVLGCVMDSLSMILLTIPIFWPVVQGLDVTFVTLADLHAARAADALAAGIDLSPDMRAQITRVLADGAELTRDQIRALELRRVSQATLDRLNADRLALWFGILVLVVVEVGLITPPVGMNLFVINAMDRATPMTATYRAVGWFVASDLMRVVLLVAVPGLVLWLVPW
ncbi:TRAP transporter large permease [Jannaschia sp. LMIT008]|uniref:TRAP transporter large permease n=1 Tax=Jannaschia maritima TaxID=3032585 RepID=UPI00281165DE|nr:TRAP transporter large permease [Jannaschia sp. LMIT008]